MRQFFVAIERLINDDPLFAKPCWYRGDRVDDVESGRPSRADKWRSCALALSDYLQECRKGIPEELTKDGRLHVDVLNGLTEESGVKRYRGRRFYPGALGCSFFNNFAGCGVPRSAARVGRVRVASVRGARDRGGKSHGERVGSRFATHCTVAANSTI